MELLNRFGFSFPYAVPFRYTSAWSILYGTAPCILAPDFEEKEGAASSYDVILK